MNILSIGDLRTLKSYFSHLEDACLIKSISKATDKMKKIESTDKVYLENTNQLFAISSKDPDKGTVRETFFLNALSLNHKAELPGIGDFLIDGQYLFEIGGRNKNFSQVKSEANSFLAVDDTEIGVGNKIPLWLFGFLY